jgi:hypothetical protein
MNGPTPMVLGLCAIVLFAPISRVAAATRCGDAAVAQAEKLLQFHVAPDKDMPVNVERESVREVGSVPALSTRIRYDVLEVWGDVYKGRYRMRFLYAHGPDCVLVGEEILEDAKP